MTLTELRYIVAVARAKHFGKAAEECCVSQPTLSVGIRKLEDYLGVTIFERGRSEVKITPVGKSIIHQAQQVLSETQVIKDIARADKDQLKKPIKIASSYTIGKYLFPHIVKQVYSYAPNLSLSLNQDYQEVLLNKLQQEELDILILNCDTTTLDYLNKNQLIAEAVLKEDLYFLTALDNKYAEKIEISLNQISHEDVLLLNRQHSLHGLVVELLNSFEQKTDLKYNEANFDSLESLYQVVKLQSAATIIPASFNYELMCNESTDIKVIPFSDPQINRTLSLVWRQDFNRIQVIDIVRRCMKAITLTGLQVIPQ